jgi:hypothetical protein
LKRAGVNGNHVPPDADARTSAGRTAMEVEGRQAVLRIYKFLRKQPGFEKLRLEYVCPEIGIRETTTVVGEVTVTVDDYSSGRVWEDAVSYSFYPIDLHGLRTQDWRAYPLADGTVATIPFRALIPAGSRNLLVAGRCFSSDRLANSAARVQASSMAMGQAAGAAAALATKQRRVVSAIPIDDIRALLREHGAIVPEPQTIAATT